jgi:hypothetical protein
MRTIVTNYTFLPASNQIVFNGYTSIVQENILLVLDATQNQVLYNPTLSGYGGTVAGNVLTLAQNTSALTNTDKIQIFYEDLSVPSASFMGGFLERILKKLGSLTFTASASGAALNANITNTVTTTVSGTVTTNSTLQASTNSVGSVTLGTSFSPAGQSQAESALIYQSSFRRNLNPI